MFKFSRYTKIFIFMLSALLSYANTASAQTDCAGGYIGYGVTATGEFIALSDPGNALQVASMPHILFDALSTLELTITNQMPNGQSLHNGYFSVEFRYTPEGGNPDGSDDVSVPSTADVEVTQLSAGQSMTAVFEPVIHIPIEQWESISCTLIYQGAIGNVLDSAILPKLFSPGNLLFNEGWDKGLTGNYAWSIDEPQAPYDQHGTATITVSDEHLTKSATRTYSDDATGYYSHLDIDLTENNTSNGLLIPPTSYLHFSVDDMTSTTIDPAIGAHVLRFIYRSGTKVIDVQYTASGPTMNIGYAPDVDAVMLYHQFQALIDVKHNIHDWILAAQVEIPEPLYLRRIVIMQQFYQPQQGPSSEHSMHLVVDDLRIVDSSVE